jgi:hypothetical protein
MNEIHIVAINPPNMDFESLLKHIFMFAPIHAIAKYVPATYIEMLYKTGCHLIS